MDPMGTIQFKPIKIGWHVLGVQSYIQTLRSLEAAMGKLKLPWRCFIHGEFYLDVPLGLLGSVGDFTPIHPPFISIGEITH